MKEDGYYTTGEFAKKAGVTIRTIRYYDSIGILKPSFINNSGYRFYSDADFVELKKILALKFLGLSLDEIVEIEKFDYKKEDLINSLNLQKSIIKNKMNNMKVILNTIETAEVTLKEKSDLNWRDAFDVVKNLESEKEILQRSRDASNLNEGVKLMDRFCLSECEWYQWIYKKLEIHPGDSILEVGCGNGALWEKNLDYIIDDVSITLTEMCEEMIEDAQSNLNGSDRNFKFQIADMDRLPFEDESFDVVIANHILFYMKDIDRVLSEIKRVVKPGGKVYCSTIGKNHMKELEGLMLSFSHNVRIPEDKLSSKFGLENGEEILKGYFSNVVKHLYEAKFVVNDSYGILEYIYSIPGNILDIIDTRKKDFEKYIKKSIESDGEFYITSNLGLFTMEKV